MSRRGSQDQEVQKSGGKGSDNSHLHYVHKTTQSEEAACRGTTHQGTAHQGKQQGKHHYHPGTRALMEIRQYQKFVEFLIPKLQFQRLAQDFKVNLHFTSDVIFALQEASEVFLINLMEDTNLCTIYRGQITIAPRDFNLVMKLCEKMV